MSIHKNQVFSYQFLTTNLQKQNIYPISIKSNYLVIMIPGMDYHITIYQNQWDDYEKQMEKPYHLFHISSNSEENRCSSYFWVNKNTHRIQKIPKRYFSYNQPSYSFNSSTRNPCHLSDIIKILKIFQKLLLKH